uniref:Uncharacterized protein n=1 Tax=Chromera velia CCMP2878 TaxID=1169474 RepID=A0A0G4H1J3_9ALVE|eukprot:Cvel_24304.t1-p1 / transcript=Cvel_24304.t1 / gene=Cvel_24304 / organism=Chromera_velia_CCMP2878 / gene_product=hypothetical protein / transcript_product=hypothetical protein / location=Cvel_scaffold2610:12894-22017(+) / protein_length=265 / sequence_SO=supercontig / SO=protein_coding / is_pseudo=false
MGRVGVGCGSWWGEVLGWEGGCEEAIMGEKNEEGRQNYTAGPTPPPTIPPRHATARTHSTGPRGRTRRDSRDKGGERTLGDLDTIYDIRSCFTSLYYAEAAMCHVRCVRKGFGSERSLLPRSSSTFSWRLRWEETSSPPFHIPSQRVSNVTFVSQAVIRSGEKVRRSKTCVLVKRRGALGWPLLRSPSRRACVGLCASESSVQPKMRVFPLWRRLPAPAASLLSRYSHGCGGQKTTTLSREERGVTAERNGVHLMIGIHVLPVRP